MHEEADKLVVEQQYHDITHPEVVRRLERAMEEGRVHGDAHLETLMRRHRRRLQLWQRDEDYGGAFLPAEEADALGLTGPMRIKLVWDAIDFGDLSADAPGADTRSTRSGSANRNSGALQCSFAGEVVWNLFTTAHTCVEEDVVTPEKRAVIDTRSDFAAGFFGEALKVRPVQDDITIYSSLADEFNLEAESRVVTDADLVIIMTARPGPGLNGYALCRQLDQHGRCTVGQFNWVPDVLDAETADNEDTIQSQRHTALHEMVHVLGGIGVNRVFVNPETGAPADPADVWYSAPETGHFAPKMMTYIKTPKVVALARAHYGCDSLQGVALEDQQTGKVAHWEARWLGPELMSYGTGTGETIFGDITFAYLEDTHQYIANYSKAGRLLPPSGDTGKDQEYEVKVQRPDDFEPPFTHTPGELRWGKNEGCDFLFGNPGEWHEDYFCNKHREFDCTADNRMSAVCSIATGWSFPSNRFTFGDCPGSSSLSDYRCTPTGTVTLNDNCISPTSCGLPSMYQYFTDADAARALGKTQGDSRTTGGFSSALDFVPVRLGYWNCADNQPKSNNSDSGQNGGDTNPLSQLLSGGDTDNMKLFGGQAYCPECRCFKSSLMDLSSGKLDTNFPTYGLCYRHNCFQEDYLQFAIESQVGRDTKWYRCPPGGGKIYIAGFSGAFHCPNATRFCQFETISGQRFSESNPFWEWVFWSIVLGIPMITMLVCIVPCCRTWAVGPRGVCKRWCGLTVFKFHEFDKSLPPEEGGGPDLLEIDSDGHIDSDLEDHIPDNPQRAILGTVNVAVGLFCFIMLCLVLAAFGSGRVSVAGAFLIVMALTVGGFAFIGWQAGCRPRLQTSCAAVTFFYVLFAACVMYGFVVAFCVLYPDSVGLALDRQWPVLVDTLPEGFLAVDLAPNGKASQALAENGGAFAGIGLLLGLALLAQLWAVTRRDVVAFPVIMSTMFTVLNYVVIAAGCCFWGAAGYLDKFNKEGFDTTGAMGLFIVLGFYLLVAGIYSIRAGHSDLDAHTEDWEEWIRRGRNPKTKPHAVKSGKMFKAMVFASTHVVLVMGVGLAMMKGAENVSSTVDRLSDDQMAATAKILGLENGSREDVALAVKSNLRTFGIAGLVILILTVLLAFSTNYVMRKVQDREKNGPIRFRDTVDGRRLAKKLARLAAAHGGEYEMGSRV